MLVDSFARFGVGFGGISVIIAITLIFFYLAWVVLPLFESAGMEPAGEYGAPGGGETATLHLALEEQAEIGIRYLADGRVVFFNIHDGSINQVKHLELPAGASIRSVAAADPASHLVLLGLSNGQVLAIKHAFDISYPNNQRKLSPKLEWPLGEEPLQVDEEEQPLTSLAVQLGEEGATMAAATEDGRLLLLALVKEDSLFEDEASFEVLRADLASEIEPAAMLLDKEQRNLYVAEADGFIRFYDISDKEYPELVERSSVLANGGQITSIRFLAGTISLIIADDRGNLGQWFPVRDENNNYTLSPVRQFEGQGGQVQALAPEYFRKGFFAADNLGDITFYHATAQRTVLHERVDGLEVRHLAVSPRADMLLAESRDGTYRVWHVENEHPEISWHSLWEQVWYEGYAEPQHLWQSSSADNDFEPKFSLTPLAFGTLKAAFYAMLLAVPLAIAGAIFTAYFMSPKMRQSVKPTIEIMEALPTVILGFLAGLWLAPFIEANLPGIFSFLVIMPIGVIAFAYAWSHAPEALRHRVPDGWEGALLIPLVILITWFAMSISPLLELWFFGGDMPLWLRDQLGIGFDQRNSLVVGLAMGFAVIPTIFSIAEDAIFSVPKHLTNGSLALGATPWQTFTRVVILTASPGIFSAVMIGMGRAVGETMIVLMATGNTPVMDFSIFQGMRTLSANIAVEMPESEVGSTHYRVLFLAALVLFLFTFFFNTLAELVRQRLRRKYSSL